MDPVADDIDWSDEVGSEVVIGKADNESFLALPDRRGGGGAGFGSSIGCERGFGSPAMACWPCVDQGESITDEVGRAAPCLLAGGGRGTGLRSDAGLEASSTVRERSRGVGFEFILGKLGSGLWGGEREV